MNTSPDPEKRETPAEIVAHIDHLMGEAEAMLAGPVSGHTVSEMTELKFRFTEAHERISELYEAVQRRVIAKARGIDTAIRAHPYEALLIALCGGVFIGKIIGRRRRVT